MAFTSFTAGNLIKSSEVNANYGEILKTSIDNALLNTTSIDVMDLIDSPFKIVDLFTDINGSNNTISNYQDYESNLISNLTYFYISSDFTQSTVYKILEPSFETIANWSYANYPTGCTAEQFLGNSVNGNYSSKLVVSNTTNYGWYARVSQSNIDFTNIVGISFWVNFTGTIYRLRVYADTDLIYTSPASISDFVNIDTSAITGNKTLKFEVNAEGYEGGNPGSGTAYIDFIKEYSSFTLVSGSIQSVNKNIGTGYKYAFVRPKLYEAIPSGADITCNISLDGGSTFTAESNINEIIDISALTDTGHLVVKMNLKTDGTVTSKVSGWACLLYK